MGSWIISSSVLIVVIMVLRYIFKGKISLRLQYGLWLVVAIRLLLPFNIGTSSFSVQNIAEKAMTQPQVKTAIEFSEQVIPVTSYESAYKEVVEKYEEEGRFIEGIGAEEMEAMEYEAYALMKEVSIAEIVQKVAFLIWFIGIVVVGATFFVSNIIFARRLKNTRKHLQVSDVKLPVYVSDLVESPCLFGVFKPAIYVTEAVAKSNTLLRHSLFHEWTHYMHGDLYWSLIRCICLSLHWYNPLVWKAAILSKQDAELACDEDTIRKLGEDERIDYGKTLIQLTCERKQELFVVATTMTSEKKSIKERIILIAGKPKLKAYALILVVAVVLTSIGCTFTNGNAEEDNIATTKEETVLYEGMYSILVEVADGHNLVVALDMDEISDAYYQVKQIYVYDGEELIQTIIPEDIPVGDIVLWEGLFVNKGNKVGEPDVRDLNFDGAEDFGLLSVSTYPKNVPYSYFLWNGEKNQFDYGFSAFGASALEVDEEARRLIVHSHDTMGEYEDYYGYSADGKLVSESELEQENKDLAPSQYLSEIDWRSMKGRFSEEDMEAIHLNLPALEGSEVTWIYRSAEGEEPNTYLHNTKQTTLQGIVDQWCKENDRESEKIVVNSFLFADVFGSGKKDICLLIEHFGWYWLILHQEDGVIYAIDMPVRWFEGVQSDGLYFGSGGAAEAYYKRMSFANGDYTEESVADVLYGVLYIDGVEQSDAVYQDWKDTYIKEEAVWHTPIK